MAFTAGELTNIANAALDYYFEKGTVFSNTIQQKPMLAMFERKAKTFPGGKGNISIGVKGSYGAAGVNDSVKGYTHNDQVVFYTPANIKRANYAWREHHIGLTLTETELKIDGISVTDENGSSTSNHSDREMTAIANLFEDKLEDLGEQYARGMDNLLHGDGVADAKALAGVAALIAANPATGTVGGIDRAASAWWRNIAYTAAHQAAGGPDAITSATADGGALISELQDIYRQATRYGGKPTEAFCGSDFLGALEKEFRANGVYSESGFTRGGDVSVGELSYKGSVFKYDPTLDSLSLPKRCYWIDTGNVFLMKMESEWRKNRAPARPHDQFVLYRSITSTGQLVGRQFNSSAVIDIK